MSVKMPKECLLAHMETCAYPPSLSNNRWQQTGQCSTESSMSLETSQSWVNQNGWSPW